MAADGELRLEQWSCAPAEPGSIEGPGGLETAGLDWLAASVPGTAAAAMLAAGRWSPASAHDFDAEDWWFRTRFERPAADRADLELAGLATIADVWLNGRHLLHSANMFRAHRVDISASLADDNELVIRCAALAPVLAARRRPRPHWKALLPSDQGLRWVRTTLLGRSPGWTPDVAPVGPWLPVTVVERPPVRLAERRIETDHDGSDGRLSVRATLELDHATAGEGDLQVTLAIDGQQARLSVEREHDGRLIAFGEITVPTAKAWWPSTHGDAPLYPAELAVHGPGLDDTLELGRVGFRSTTFGPSEAPVLRWNGADVFVRGACWVPLDPIGLASSRDELAQALGRLRDAGLNIVRVQGSLLYETDEFLDVCDELGMLVWHDLMFATLDYPADDPEFSAEVLAEVAGVLDRLAGHPCVAVVNGSCELGQQAAMLGRPIGEATIGLFGKVLADLVAERLPGVAYEWTSPRWSGDHLNVSSGTSHYFGVGGYQRPLSDARLSGVRFATECLALANLPGDDAIGALAAAGASVGTAAWTAGVPHDHGRSWDFEDVRDHYVHDRFGVDPRAIRATDAGHYLDLGRAAAAEVFGRTLSDWRRAGSTCRGALVLAARDLRAGTGFGITDHHGRPKSVWFALRRVLRPRALLLTDEGLSGLAVEAVNDLDEPAVGTLRVAAYAGRNVVADAEIACTVAPRSSLCSSADAVLGSFYDLTYAYRFGPRSIDSVAASWRIEGEAAIDAVFLPDGAPLSRSEIGLAGSLRTLDDAHRELVVTTDRAARCVLIDAPGALPSDDAFDLAANGRTVIDLRGPQPPYVSLRAVNGLNPVSATVADG